MNIKPLTLTQRLRVHGVNASPNDWATLESDQLELRKYRAEAAIAGCSSPDELRQKLLQRTSEVAILTTTDPTITEALSCEIDSLREDLKAAREALEPLLQANTDLTNAFNRLVREHDQALARLAAADEPLKPSFAQEARAHRLSLSDLPA